MKIAFFVSTFPALSETFVATQVIALQKSGHLVHIYSQNTPAKGVIHEMILDAKLLDVTSYLDDIPKLRIEKMLLLLKKSARNIFGPANKALFKALFRNTSLLSVYNLIPFFNKPYYDILHAHFGFNGNYVVQLRELGLFKKAKFITTFHGYDLEPKLKNNNFYTKLFSTCNLFTVSTNYSKSLLAQLGCDEKKIKVLPAGLDVPAFKKTEKRDVNKELHLLFVGRLIKLKGPSLFVQICKMLKEKKAFAFKAVIIGEGEMLQELIELIELADVKDEVVLVGVKNQGEVMRYMDNADIFVLPGIVVNGLSEAQGLVIQEAQAMELPVIVSDAGGMPEGMQDKVTGFVVKEGDTQDFAEKICYLHQYPEKAIVMGRNGRQFVEKNFDIKWLNEKLLEIYNS